MHGMGNKIAFLLVIFLICSPVLAMGKKPHDMEGMNRVWSETKAWEWYNEQPWLVGCNYLPATASNQLEMWQEETFDPETIDRELRWASEIGFNVVRVFLHDVP